MQFKLFQFYKPFARRSPQTAADLARLAILAGRKKYPGSNHPMWMSNFATHRAFPIPVHGGNPHVGDRPQKVVLDHLEADAAAWVEFLADEKKLRNGEE